MLPSAPNATAVQFGDRDALTARTSDDSRSTFAANEQRKKVDRSIESSTIESDAKYHGCRTDIDSTKHAHGPSQLGYVVVDDNDDGSSIGEISEKDEISGDEA